MDPDKIENNIVDLSKINKNALRTLWQENELDSHNELDTENKPAKIFYVSNGLTSSSTTAQSVVTGATTICSNYSTSESWRAPNQRELTLLSMLSLINSSQNYQSFCRTKSSNENLNYSWQAFNNWISGASSSNTYYIRCVRDHEDMKK